MALPHEELPPMVSVVIPTFNGGDWLLEAIASCRRQGAVALELIVVDDASTDNTPDLVAKHYPEVRLIRSISNSGSGALGRNTGLQLARGRYVKFLDHDDQLEPHSLALEVNAAEASNADLVMSRWGDVRTDSQGLHLESSKRVFIPPDPERLTEAILRGEKLPYTAAILYRRSYIENQRWDARLTINDDFDWFCRNVAQGGKIIRCDHVSYYWRLHPLSIQGKQALNRKAFVESAHIKNHIYTAFGNSLEEQGKLSPYFRTLLAEQLYKNLRILARFNHKACRRTLSYIRQLKPTFKPEPAIEQNLAVRTLSSLVGLDITLYLYRMLMLLPDQMRFRGTHQSYYPMR